MAEKEIHVVVVGAGYAGLVAATRLAARLKRPIREGTVAVTLVSADHVFVERLRLHQLAAGRAVSHRPIASILNGTGISFVCGALTAIRTSAQAVLIESDAGQRSIRYDRLVYALGSTISRHSVPGARESAFVLTPSGPRSASELRDKLRALPDGGHGQRLLVCGAGATGIEAAAELADAYPRLRVQLATSGQFGRFTTERVSAYMRGSLTRMGIEILEHTNIIGVEAGLALTADGRALEHDICLWTGGFSVSPLALEAGLAVNEQGQILIDPFMRSVSQPEIYAAGDAAHPVEMPGAPVRMAAFCAVVMGAHAADCLTAELRGKVGTPFSFAYAGQGIALGRTDAIGFNTYPDDRPRWPYFSGRAGYEVREFFVRLLARLPDFERRWPGSFIWLGKGRYAAQRRAALAPRPAVSVQGPPDSRDRHRSHR